MSKIYTAIMLAIGLIITSCTKLTDREYLFPSPELTVVVPDSITSGIITFTISAKNATNLAYIIVRGVGNIDYYSLLQGEYSDAYMTSINPDGFEHTFNIKDVFPNESYSLYVAVSNNHNQIATFKKGYNYETIPPYITYISDTKGHTATNNGTRTTITFNEDIVRNDDMGAITYDVLDENLDYIATGTATATASGCQLTVSLPSSTVFEQLVFVLLSFEKGAVEDLCGNKMTAIENGLDYDLLPNGPWYMYDPTVVNDEDALFKSDMGYCYYGVSTSFTQDKSETTVGSEFFNVTLAQANFDLTQYFGESLTGDKWTMPSIMSILQGAEPADVPAFSYEAKANDGQTYTWLTFFDPESSNGLSFVGQYDLPAAGLGVVDCYSAGYDASSGSLYTSWDFVYADRNGQMILQNAGYKPCVIFFDGQDPYILFDFEDLLILDETMVGAAGANFYEQPVRLENVTIVKRNFNHVIKK